MAKTTKQDYEFQYAAGTRRALIVITLLLALLIPLSATDEAAWIGGAPIVTIILVPIVLAFLWIIWQDTTQRITITKESITWQTGAWRWRKVVEIPWSDVAQMRDAAYVFSNTRKYDIISATDENSKIRINTTYNGYRDLFKLVIARVPSGRIDERAKKSLKRMRVM